MEEQPKAHGYQDESPKKKILGALVAASGVFLVVEITISFLGNSEYMGYSFYWPASILLILTSLGALLSATFIIRGLFGGIMSWDRPKGVLIDVLLPPEEAEHRCIALEEGFERWEARYGLRRARWIYVWQVVQTIGFFYYSKFRKG